MKKTVKNSKTNDDKTVKNSEKSQRSAFLPAKVIVFNAEFLVSDSQFLVFNTKFISFTHRRPVPHTSAPIVSLFAVPPPLSSCTRTRPCPHLSDTNGFATQSDTMPTADILITAASLSDLRATGSSGPSKIHHFQYKVHHF